MPPKVSITKKLVLEAAFEIVQKDGLNGLTARHIADKLNCSTAPVYSTFKNMAELEEDVMFMARDLLVEYTRKEYSEMSFLNMGVGFVMFSREKKNLYRDLFLSGDRFKVLLDELDAIMLDTLIHDQQFSDLPKESKRDLLTKMWTFTHGLASLTCVGLFKDDSNENIIRLMAETGRAVIMDTYLQNGMDDISIWKTMCLENIGDR